MIGSLRTEYYKEQENSEGLRENLDLLEEQRVLSSIGQDAYKKAVERYYNQRVRNKAFRVGDYVLKKTKSAMPNPGGS